MTQDDRKKDRRRYLLGYIACAGLTAAMFALVLVDGSAGRSLMVAIGGAAMLQIALQFYFFLHIDLQKSHRDDLQLILFTALIAIIMVGGTIWIAMNQFAVMGSNEPAPAIKEITK